MTSAQRFASKSFVATPLVLALLVSGCGSPFKPLPGPVEYGRSPKPEGTLAGTPTDKAVVASTQIERMPVPVAAKSSTGATPPAVSPPSPGDEEEVTIAIEQTPLPMFIQILYGSVLKKAYSLDPAVTSRTDPVTFKTSRPMSKARMQQVAGNLLRSYGLAVIDLDGLVRIAPDTVNNSSTRVQTGKQLPESVDQFRPGFQYVELDTVRISEMAQWVRQVMGPRITLTEDAARNGVMLAGAQADIKAALDLIQAFDQPRMRGRIARRISPAYATVNDLATRLNEVLTTQGYAVSVGGSNGAAAIVLMPVAATSSLFVFASSVPAMEHIERWARELDKPSTVASSNALFTYPVKFADAQELAKTLGELLGGGAPTPAAAGAAAPRAFGRVVVNNATNTLIFKGSSADEQQQIKDLLRELDRPTKSAMIEVVVAEVTRGALERLGIKWDYNNGGVAGANQRVLKAGSAGLSISLGNNAATILGALDALAFDNQARILSNPKVLARNGETASIQVGNEVPIITSQQSTTAGSTFLPGSNSIIQQVQYRSTGVILRVRPVINSGNRLDLDVSQEVSSAASTETGVSSSPTILTRRIETKLSLRDGSTILLGGLISRNDSVSDAGVPLLKDIPGVGALFKTKSNTNNQTELLVMITPYVVNDDYEAEELTQAVQATFGDWAKDIKTSRVAREPQLGLAIEPAAAPDPAPQQDGSSTKAALPPATASARKEMPVEPVANKLTPDADEVQVSRPINRPAENAPTVGQKPSSVPAPAAAASVPAGKTLPSKPPAPLPAGTSGTNVTDPKVRDEILKLLKPK
jgi:general secretion pathway protein D